jgi:hypothetical protein
LVAYLIDIVVEQLADEVYVGCYVIDEIEAALEQHTWKES